MRAYLEARNRSRFTWSAVLLVGVSLVIALPYIRAQEPAAPPPPAELPPAPLPEVDVRSAVDAGVDPAGTADASTRKGLPSVTYSEAGLTPGEDPEPGARVELDIRDESAAPGTSYRWVQVEGPRVAIPDPERRAIEVEIPTEGGRMSFLRIATAPSAVRIVRFVVPVRSSAAQPATATGPVRADAGDDQVGLIGHRVTLNGSRSAPSEGLVYRWIQVGGPPILSPQQDRAFYSFVPTNSGLYQFALVVGGNGTVSEPDPVSVLVGASPMASGSMPGGPQTSGSPAPAMPAAPPAPPTLPSPMSLLGSALPRLADANRLAGEVADVFEAVAERAPLYTSFGDLQSELSRRLDVVIPADPNQRQAWSQMVLQPLTLHTIQQMLVIGVDVRQYAGLTQPLAPAQREQMRSHFQALARAFRQAAPPSRE